MKRHDQASMASVPSLTAVIALLCAGPAMAQGAQPSTDATDQGADNESGSKATDAEIVVTGTRISRAGFLAPTPTTIVGAAAIEARAAVNISEILYELPSIRASLPFNNTATVGGNFVNLRSFGTGGSRTLILLDGRRLVPTTSGGQVDLNTIPTALVERLDIITGGASAAYGSDAVSGVVNVILKKKLQGFQGNLQSGISAQGDARNLSGSLAWGTGFADGRGQFMVASEYSKLSNTPRQKDRAYSAQRTGFVLNAAGTQTDVVNNIVTGGYTNGGVLIAANGARLATNSPLYGRQFLSSTSSSPFNYGILTPGAANTQIGGDGYARGDDLLLTAPIERYSVFARGSYELTSDLKIWAEGSFSRSRVDVDLYPNAIKTGNVEPFITENTRVSSYSAAGVLLGTVDNPLIPADVLAILKANNIPSVTIGRMAPDLGTQHTDSRVRVIRGALGLEGRFGDNWRWEVNYTHGETRFETDLSDNIIEPNLAAALDVVVLNGTPTCRVNVPGLGAGTGLSLNHSDGCVVANPFGPGSLASAKSYVTGTLNNRLDYTQDAASASIQGEPFSTWAGPVSVVAGAEWRKETAVQITSPFANILNGTLLPTGSFQQANARNFSGKETVKEVFGEIAIPLLKDSALGRSLDLSGAVRYTNYSTSGSVTTWKVGATYSPIEGILFRGVQSRDIRAANLSEKYATSSGNSTLRSVTNANLVFVTTTFGNPNIVPEVADTTSLGVSLSGNLIPGLSLSVDWYRIKLAGAIGTLANQNILDYCYGSSRAGSTVAVADPARCDATVSGPAGVGLAALAGAGPYSLVVQPQNIGNLSTKGFDFEVGYRLPLSEIVAKSNGVLSVRMLATYVDELIFNTTGALAVSRVGDLNGAPKWRWTMTGTYQDGPLTLTGQGRFLSGLDLDKSVTNAALLPVQRSTPAAFYLNLGVAYRIIDTPENKLEFYINVNNLFDRDPPLTGAIPAGAAINQTSAVSASYTNNAYYDVIGRAYSAGVRFKF